MTALTSRRQTVAATLVCCAAMGCAHAQETKTEKLKLSAGIAQSRDSNFQRVIDANAVSDQINIQTLDVVVALPYGQQRLDLEAKLANNKHQTLSQFDYTGQNYNVAWRWSVTPALVGTLSSKRTETLNSAADSLDPSLRNTNVTKTDNLNGVYLLGGSWQVIADYSKGVSTNERAVLGMTDIRYQSYAAGVGYTPSAGNSLNYARRIDTGTSISDYRYDGHSIVANYAFTTHTNIKGRIAYIEQRYAMDPKFDFSGITGGLEGTWRVTPKTSIDASWLRDIASFQTVNSTHARIDTLSIGPSWQARPTVVVNLTFRQSQRDSLGSLNGTASTRQDRMRETVGAIRWQPRTYVGVYGSFAKASRTSSVVDQDYTSQTATIGAQFTY